MRFGVFYELQMPKPWKQGDEHRLFHEALDQVELADREIPILKASVTRAQVNRGSEAT